MEQRIRVAVVDHHPLFREGVAVTLSEAAGFEMVAQGDTTEDAIRIAHGCSPDILLLDINVPGDAMSSVSAILKAHTNLKIVILTMSEADSHVSAAIKAGASGYIVKNVTGPDLLKAVGTIVTGIRYLTPSLATRILLERLTTTDVPASEKWISHLSRREGEIVHNVARGLTNKEIARELGLSEKTVKHHMTSIMQKLKVRNRTEIAIVVSRASLFFGVLCERLSLAVLI